MEARIEPTRREQAVELLVFLLLIVPSIVLSIFARSFEQAGFVLLSASTIFRNLALVALVIFFLWRNGEPLRLLGWTTKDLPMNLVLGLALTPFVMFGVGIIAGTLEGIGLSGRQEAVPGFLRPAGLAQYVLAVLLVAVVAVSEETIFRGYLISRIGGITRSLPAAVILSSIIFSLGHAYQGVVGVLAVGAMGLAFALLLISRKSLVAPVVIHFVNNFIGIVVVPLALY